MSDLDHEYFMARAMAAQRLANIATDLEIRIIHERMAKDYATLAELRLPAKLRLASDR